MGTQTEVKLGIIGGVHLREKIHALSVDIVNIVVLSALYKFLQISNER